VLVPNRMLVEIRGTPAACKASWHGFTAAKTSAPIALDVGSVRVKVCLKPCLHEVTNGENSLETEDSDADRNHAQICNDFR
jgi:hypothetical protein